MTGHIDVLNTGLGHAEFRFNIDDTIETDRAKRVVLDMLKRGYALFVHGTDEKLVRVEQFDDKKGVYIVADVPTIDATPPPPPIKEPTDLNESLPEPPPEMKRTVRGKSKKEVSMHKAKITAIGRSAGG